MSKQNRAKVTIYSTMSKQNRAKVTGMTTVNILVN